MEILLPLHGDSDSDSEAKRFLALKRSGRDNLIMLEVTGREVEVKLDELFAAVTAFQATEE